MCWSWFSSWTSCLHPFEVPYSDLGLILHAFGVWLTFLGTDSHSPPHLVLSTVSLVLTSCILPCLLLRISLSPGCYCGKNISRVLLGSVHQFRAKLCPEVAHSLGRGKTCQKGFICLSFRIEDRSSYCSFIVTHTPLYPIPFLNPGKPEIFNNL